MNALPTLVRTLWGLLGPRHRLMWVFVFVLGLCNAALETAVAAVLACFANAVVSPHAFLGRKLVIKGLDRLHIAPLAPHQLVLLVGLLAITAVIFRVLGNLLKAYVEAYFSATSQAYLANRLYKSLLYKSYSWHTHHNSGLLVKSAVFEIAHLTGILFHCSNLASECLISFLFVLILFFKVGAVTVPILFFLAVVGFLANRSLKSKIFLLSQRLREIRNQSMLLVSQSFQGIKDTKIVACEQVFASRLALFKEEDARVEREMRLTIEGPRNVVDILGYIGLVAIVTTITLKSASVEDNLSRLSLLMAMFLRLVQSVNRSSATVSIVTSFLPSAQHALTYIDPIEPVDPAMPELPEGLAEPLQAVELDRVEFRYSESGPKVLDQVSFSIRKNETLGLVGPSGSGKSTIADLLLGLIQPQGGQIRLNGKDLSSVIGHFRKRIICVSQTPFLADTTIAANVAFGCQEIDPEMVWKCLRSAQLEDYVRSLPEALETTLGERGVKLSGGQRQRIAIARALYFQPEMIVLDEATSALDNLTEAAFLAMLEHLKGQVTLVIIAHRLSTVRRCDRLLYLSGGQLQGNGTHEQLMQSCPGYVDLVQAQSTLD